MAGTIDYFDSSDNLLALNVAQYNALVAANIALTTSDVVTLKDTGANLATVDFSKLSTNGIDIVDSSNNALTLSVAQYQALGTTTLTAADVVTLGDTGAALAALGTSDFSALAGNGIDKIDSTTNTLSLGLDKFNALGTVQLTPADAVTVTGTSGDDNFIFSTQKFGAEDSVNGGSAGNDTLSLSGNYSSGLTFGANGLVSIEQLSLGAGFSYKLTTSNANVAAGAVLQVSDQNSLAGDTLTFNGAAELDGSFHLFGGAGNVDFTGGRKGDTVDLGSGNATLHYTTALQSTGVNYDTVNGFNFDTDHFDVAGSVTQALTGSGNLNPGNFNASLTAAMNGLLVQNSAVLFTAGAGSGSLAGAQFLVVDQNGTAGYQANQDLVVKLGTTSGTYGTGSFS
jgi:hypothetical protein